MRKRVKSLIGMIIAMTMILPTALPVTTPVSAQNSYGFNDFPTGWSAPAMSHAVENGLIYGKSEDRICPTDNLTRAEMATIINRAFGATVEKDISAFSDVAQSAWYYNEIKKAYNMQTLYGDAGGTMRPDAFIIREEAIAIVARAMVLSGYSASNLDKFNDKDQIADWAVDPLASMVANGYVNGDEKSNMNPKAFITREEFAQLLHNIVKHYYDAEDGVTTFNGNVMINEPTTSLSDLVVNGDLILGDGVGTSNIVLKNVKVTGRILIRGATHISFKNSNFGGGVTVKNVNDVVHFDHFSDEVHFNDMQDHTEVTFKKKTTGGGGGGTPPAPTTASYKVEHYQEALDGSFAVFETETLSGSIGASVTAVAKTYTGFSEDTVNPSRVATGTVVSDGSLTLKLFYTRNSYTVTFDARGGAISGTPKTVYKFGETLELPVPTKGTDTFGGWWTALNGTGTKIENTSVLGTDITSAAITVYAHWIPAAPTPTATTFTVKHLFEKLDGTYETKAERGDELNVAGDITVSIVPENYRNPIAGFNYFDYSFDGTDNAGMPKADGSTVLNIRYNRKSYDIVYNYGEAGGSNTVSFRYGESVDLSIPTVTPPVGKYFAGWYDALVGGTQVTFLETPVGGTTIYARWAEDVGVYTVEFYQQNLDGTYTQVTADTLSGLTGVVGTDVSVDKNSTTIKDKYIGFEVNETESTLTQRLAKTGTVLKVYYDRKIYTIDYDFDGGYADGTYTDTFMYGQTVALAKGKNSNGKVLGGWFTDLDGNGTQVTDTANIDAILGALTGNTITLYAYWVEEIGEYSVEFYQETLDGADYTLVAADTIVGLTGTVGEKVAIDATIDEVKNKYSGFTVNVAKSELSKTLAKEGTVLKVYYDRNIYTLYYNYSDADTVGIGSATFKHGQNITFPDESTFNKESFSFAGWYTTQDFKDDEVVDTGNTIEQIIDIANGETETTIYAKWAKFFTVTFREGAKIGTYTVDPAVENTVPYSAFPYDKLVERYKTGYFEDESVSSVYAGNEYKHTFEGQWYYTDENGNDVVFTDETIVDRDLTVRYKFRYVRLELFVEKLGHNLVLEVPFEESTRIIDTIKDELFVNQEKILLVADEVDARSKFMALNLKLVNFLDSKGIEIVEPGMIFAEDGEILKQHIRFNAFAYLDEASVKTVVVNAIRTTFKNDPLRMRGVIDEMMTEQDEDVVNLMDTMLVSMLSGSDAARIKGIIADAVEDAVANDTTGEFKNKIKDIITTQLDAGNTTVETSIKKAIKDYFMNSANDAKIREIVSDLIDDAYKTDDETDPVRNFVKSYIKTYLNENPTVLDDMIREMGENLDPNDPNDAHIIDLIHEVLDENVIYLEKLVDDAIKNLKNTIGEPIHSFIVDAITTELSTNAAELDILIDEISNANVTDIKSVLATVMEDNDTFEIIVKDAIADEAVFNKVIKAALDNASVFDAIVSELCSGDTSFYNMLVDIALSSDSLKGEVKNAVVNNDDALISVLNEVASDASLKAEMVEEILVASDAKLKDQLTSPLSITSDYYADVKAQALSQAETEIIGIIETGINEDEHPDYWPIAFEKAMEIAEARVRQDLIAGSVDPNGSLWDTMYAEAMAQAAIDVKAELNGGITDASEYYAAAVNGAKEQAEKEITDLLSTGITEGSKYWDVAYSTAKGILRTEIDTSFDSKIVEIKTDANLKAQVVAWAQTAINNTNIESAIKNYAKGLATSTDSADVSLRTSIIDTVINTADSLEPGKKETLVSDIITELLKPANATVKETVENKAIEVLNRAENNALKTTLIDSVLEDIFADNTLKGDLIARLKTKVKDPAQEAFKLTVISEAINAVVNDSSVNARAVIIINDLIETDTAFKADIIEHIVDYILEDATVRAEAMEKVVEMIEDPEDDSHKQEAIDFAFDTLKGDTTKRAEIVDKFLTNILGNNDKREDMATEVIDIMFSNDTLRNRILDLGFEQMFAGEDTIAEIVSLALDELISDDTVRRDMIIAVISTESGRRKILDILFDELERDPEFIDEIVDIAMNGKYGDLVDIFVSDLIYNGKIQINPDNRQIAEEIVLPMLDDISLDTVLGKLPAKVTDVLPTSVIEKAFNKFKSKARELLVEGINEAKEGNWKDISVMVDNELDIINEVLVPLYNKVFPKVVDKAEDFYYYNENVYLKAIVDMIDPEFLLDNTKPASIGGTGYRLRTTEEYYEIIRNISVLVDDAANWYMENISDDQINGAIDKVAGKVNTLLAKVNGLVGGRIPMSKIDKVVEYTKKALDKRESVYNITTNGVFEKVDKVYNKLIEIVKNKTGVDITKSTTIEVTFDGSEIDVNGKDVNIDNRKISISVKGYKFELDSESITALNKTVNIDRFVQKAADLFGTRSVTFKIINDAPYSYGAYVGNNYIKLAAEYK